MKDVVDYLVETVGSTLTGLGKDHDRVKQDAEARLVDLFERYVYGDVSSYFLIGESDEVYLYDGRAYRKGRNNEDLLKNVIKEAMKRMDVGLVYQKNSYAKIAQQCLSGMKVTPGAIFVPDRRYVVFGNGVLDLDSGRLNPFGMQYRTDVVLGFDYRPGYRDVLWDRVLCQTIPDDGMRKAFQMFCGAFLTNRRDFSIEYVCYLLGSGRNGKSVVTGAISGVFGDGLVSSFSLQELLYDTDKQYNRAALVGKIANFSDDVSKKDYSGGAYKQLVSGHKMTARNPYGRPFELTEVPYLVCCVNEMPPTTDDTLGHYRRMLPILCPNKISYRDADEELPAKLSAPDVKAAIMNWVIEGRRMVIAAKGKIEISTSIREEVERQQDMGNSARRWISDCGFRAVRNPLPNDSGWRPMAEWMEMYRSYCKDFNEMPKTAVAVGRIFAEKGFAMRRQRGGTWWCIGQDDGYESELVAPGRPQEPGSSMPVVEDLPF